MILGGTYLGIAARCARAAIYSQRSSGAGASSITPARLRERRLRGARRSDQTGGPGLGRGRDNTAVDVVVCGRAFET